MGKNHTKEMFPLSYSQQNIWNLEQAYPGISINNICTALYIEGNFRVDLLQRCIGYAYEVFPVLRTRITYENGKALQYISDEMPVPAPFIDFSKTNQRGGEVWNRSAAREHLPLYNMNLCQMTIFKLSENEGGIMTRVHHIIADAWSQALVTNHIIHNYFQLLQLKEPDLQISPDYRAHIDMERKYIASRNFERDKEYWRAALQNFPVTQLKEHRYSKISPIGVRRSIYLTSRMNRMIASFCEQKRVSPFAVFYMGIAIYMCRMKNQKRFCIGIPTINRLNYKEKQSAGMFVNTLPFVNEIDDCMTLNELNDKLKDDWFSLLYHQRIPFEEIKKILVSENDTIPEQLFGLALSYQNGKMDHLRGARVTVEGRWIYSGYQAEALCIHVSSRDAQNQFLIDYDYLTQIFSDSDIEQFHEHFMQILKHALLNPDLPVKDLDIIGEEEEEKLIFHFNQADCWYPREHSLKSELIEIAREHPERAALIWEGQRLTYRGLLEQAQEDARRIRRLLPEGEHVIAVLMERQSALFQMMVSITCSGHPWLLLDAGLPDGRLQMMIEQSRAYLCICSEGLKEKLDGCECRKLTPQELGELEPDMEDNPEIPAHSLAYIVYTSGSTGRPKAVAIEHRSVLNLAVNMSGIYPKGAVLSLCNIGFDAFILESIAALLNGKTIVIVPDNEINDSGSLADYITGYDVGFMALTPSRLGTYLKDDRFCHALKKLECIICGGENLPAELLYHVRKYSGASLYNQYGPSEATVAVSHARVTGDRRVTIGKPFANCRIYILDANRKALPVGCAGEIYIGGDCLARGYYLDEVLTEERFVPDPFIPGERLYCTGDLGEWTEEGEIFFLGRKDRQLKLLGHRIEPGEVEERLCACPGVLRAAVAVFKNQLIAFYTGESTIAPDEVLAQAAEYLPRYMLPVYAEQLTELPETSGGKTDYNRLPEPKLPDNSEAPADETEEKILAVWKGILGKEEIGIHSDYFLCGGDSLNAVAMLAELEKIFGRLLKLEEVYHNSTVRKLANLLRGGCPRRTEEYIKKAPELAVYPLSAAQQSFYVLEQADDTKMSYHMAGVFETQGSLDKERLCSAFAQLVAEEEQFRTGFEIHDGEVAARVHGEVAFRLEEAEGNSLNEALSKLARPFNLSKPPLMRAALYEEGSRQYLLLDVHHIISDGISSVLTMKRLDAYYRGSKPSLPEFTYKDYAWACRNDSEAVKEQSSFWEELLKEGMPELKLPLDRVRPSVFDGRGSRLYFQITPEQGDVLETFAQDNKLTVFTVLFSAFAVLLSGLAGQERFAVGSPLAGRRHSVLQDMIGVFVNTLPIPVNLQREESTLAFMGRMQEQITAVIDHQAVPFEEIVKKAGVTPSREKNPLFTTLFSLAPLNPDAFTLGEVELKFVPQDIHAVKVDLHLEATPSAGGYRFCFEYADRLFDKETIAYYSRCYVHILTELFRVPEKLRAINMVSPGDKMRLLEKPAYMRTPYEKVCINRIIDRYAVWKQNETAVCWGDGMSLTYEEVKMHAESLAWGLQAKGVMRGDVVAFMPRRNGTMLVTMLGILKAGAAYLPIDAAFPKERVEYMLSVAKAACLIAGEGIEFETDICAVYTVKDLFEKERTVGGQNVHGGGKTGQRSPDDAANVIFTSGSTGRPKGVVMLHKALANLASHDGPILGGENDCILCASNCVFDVFTTETILALAAGRRISVADEEEMLLPWKMARRIIKDGATILQFTPSRMQMCLNEESFCQALAQIQIIILMGEPWTMQLKDRLKKLTDAKIYNIYGPTETSVYNCQGEIREADAIHIGKPIGNCRYYLLDKDKEPVMPGAIGEIYIAGECLAAGYMNRKELTEEVFVEDPFFPGERMYKTGDVGRLRPDGNWQCLGRVDSQLKLNGHRIEPEEIAQQIVESGQCSEAAVLPVKENGIPQYLKAYGVPGKSYDKNELMKYLASRLPDYMVPSEFVPIGEMPKTASGKIDYHALDTWESNAVDPAESDIISSESQGLNDGNFIKDIWREVLKKEPLETTSFFEQGGTSLKAIIVLNYYYKHHYDLSLNDFYRFPTLKEQMEMLECEMQGHESGKDITSAGKDEEAVGEQEEIQEEIELDSPPIEVKGKTILLTGATGYLGAHLLRELLGQGAGKVICLLRNFSDVRLRETLNLYFGSEFYLDNWGRIESICGEMTAHNLGLSETAYEELAERTDIIVHSAADVRHFAPEDELMRANTRGTEEMLALAKNGGCAFAHMSTVSVAGEYLYRTPDKWAVFRESSLNIGQNWQENGYAKTKMLAEKQVFAASREGLHVKVFRVGRLVSRQSDGIFQKNPQTNAFYRLIRGMAELGRYPKILNEIPFEMTPVDLAVESIVKLFASSMKCFHILNTNQYTLGEILQELCGIPAIENEEFDCLIRETVQECDEPVSEYVRAAAEMWVSGTGLKTKIQVEAEMTSNELEKAGFRWKLPDLGIWKNRIKSEVK